MNNEHNAHRDVRFCPCVICPESKICIASCLYFSQYVSQSSVDIRKINFEMLEIRIKNGDFNK